MLERSSIGAFILAGGLSRRMGRDKAMLEWHGRTLLDHMVQRVSSAFNPVRIVGRDVLPDRIPGLGPLGGIATALQIAETERNLFVAVDLPFLTPEFLKLFKNRIQASPKHVIACRIGSGYPLCVGLDRRILERVQARMDAGELSLHGFIDAADTEVVLDVDPALFSNINTPADWERLRDFS